MRPCRAEVTGDIALLVIQQYDNALLTCATEKEQLIKAILAQENTK